MIKNREQMLDKVCDLYEAIISRAAERYVNNTAYTQLDRAGLECTKLEELFRPMWGLAPILKERTVMLHVNGEQINAIDFYKKLMLTGTSAVSEKRFDRFVTDYDLDFFSNQSITEIAGYLTCVFFAKDILWDTMSKAEQDQVANWIKHWAIYALRHSWPNNHYWYPVFCVEILKHLGYDLSETNGDIEKAMCVLDSLYVEKGWYTDGEFGRFDYYEAWAHHCYTLLYILVGDKTRADYAERCERYKRRSEEFLNFFAHYFDSDGGMAAYGRSICYRFAAVSAYGLAAKVGCDFDLGLAKSLILKNISYFFDKSIMSQPNILPDGYLYDAFSFVESYTSEGSNYCYTEGFMCLLCDADSPLWQSEESLIPIEKGNFLIQCPVAGVGLVLQGNNKKNGVTIFNNSIHYYQKPYFVDFFNDMAGYYSKFAYNSRSGFSLSTRDLVSSENMISLFTPDGQMGSHRQGVHTISTSPDHMVSWHTPFSNDQETKIVTHIVPLDNGYHLRVHEVRLSQEYIVMEGGFSVGILDDNFTAGDGEVRARNQISQIHVVSNVECRLGNEAVHPGMHLLMPRAIYPRYSTGVLKAGDYCFASLIYFSTDGIVESVPKIVLTDGYVSVDDDGSVHTIKLKGVSICNG